MDIDPNQIEGIGKSPVPLFPYYLSKYCNKVFDKYQACLKKYDDPSKCEEEGNSSSKCFSSFWRTIGTECLSTVDRNATDESGQFKTEFLNSFDNCLNAVSMKEYSSNSQLVSPLENYPMDLPSIQASCSTMGFIFTRKNCKDSFDRYRKCRKSSDVTVCSEEGRELAVRTMRYSTTVVASCVTAAASLYKAKLGENMTDAPPAELETLTHFYQCLSSSSK